MKGKLTGLLLMSLFSFSSCGIWLDYHHLNSFNERSYESFLSHFEQSVFEIDSTICGYEQFNKYRSLFSDSIWRNSYSGQPMQILYFQQDKLVSYHINCYAKGGLVGINWNMDGRFDTFPPLSALPIDSIQLNFKDLASIFNCEDEHPYEILIFWSQMFPKSSQLAIETVLENVKLIDSISDLRIHLINTDYYYLHK